MGRHGAAILRRWAFMQHVSKACASDAEANAAVQPPGSASPSSGAARCLTLIQAGREGDCLARAAEAFLEAAWSELRLFALRELRDYAVVMGLLDRANGPADPASLAAAALHMWRRCPLLEALHRAPADLLGDLDEAVAEALAPGPLAALRGATSVLLDSWREGLTQLGGLLLLQCDAAVDMAEDAAATVGMAKLPEGCPAATGLRTGGEEGMGAERRAAWLLSWRLYAAVHRRFATVWTGKQQLTVSLEQCLRGAGGPTPHPSCGSGLSATSWRAEEKSCHPYPTARGNAEGVSCMYSRRSSAAGDRPLGNMFAGDDGAGGGGGGGGNDGKSGRCGSATVGARAGSQLGAPRPQSVFANFVSTCARRAAGAVISSVAATGALCGPPRPWACNWPSAAMGPSHADAAERVLWAACNRVVTQLQDALSEDLSEDDLERRVRRLSPAPPGEQREAAPTSVATGGAPPGTAAAAPPPPDPASPQAPSDPGASPCLLSGDASSQPGAAVQLAAPRTSSRLEPSAAAAACVDPAAALPGALLAEMSSERVSRLRNSPGIKLQLALLQRLRQVEVPAGAERVCVSSGRDDAAERHACRAALVYGTCLFLHQTHGRLACAHIASGICPPPSAEGAVSSCDRAIQGFLPGLQPSTPLCSAVRLQLPSEAASPHVEAAAIAAGAAALAAAGARPVLPADGTAAARAAAAEKAAAWIAGRFAARVGVGGGNGSGSGSSDRCEVVQRPAVCPAAADEEVSSTWGSPAWAREVECRAAALLAAVGPEGERNGSHHAMTVTGPAVATAEGCSPEDAATGDGLGRRGSQSPELLLEALLLLCAGRVRLLGLSLGGPGNARGLLQYRWGSTDPPSAGAAAAAAAAAAAGDHLTASSSLQPRAGACTPVTAHLASSPTGRALLLHMSVSAATAATNRLTHVSTMHALGSGSDLRPLCMAHSDAVTLGSAAQVLLGLACAMGGAQTGQQAQFREGGEAAQRAAIQRLAAAPMKAHGGGQGGLAAATAQEGTVAGPLSHRQSAPVVNDSGQPGPGTRFSAIVKINWRRSLRRIMPYRSERGGNSGRGIGAAAATSGSTGANTTGPSPHGPAVSRACWAGEPIEPVPLPPPAPLCSISTAHLLAAEAAQGPQAVAVAAAAASAPWRWPLCHVFRGARTSAADASGLSGSSSGPGSSGGSSSFGGAAAAAEGLMGAEEWAQGGRRAWPQGCGAAGPLVLSAAEASLLVALQTVCSQLRAAAARAGEVLEAEMGQRAAVICRHSTSKGNGSAAEAQAGGPGRAAAAAQQVAASLLRPLREALAGLHPLSQSELLIRGFSAGLSALRQHLTGGSGSGGGGGSQAVNRRRAGGAGGRVANLSVQAGEGLALIEEELAAGWRQVEAAAGVGAGGAEMRGGGWAAAAATFGLEAGEYGLVSARRELEAQMRALRTEAAGRTAM